MNRTRMVASSISTILRRTLPSTSRCISFVTFDSQTLSQRQPTVPYSLEHSSSVLLISRKIFPLKIQLFGGGFCSKSGDRTNSRCWNCDASLEKMPFVFCDSCDCIQPLDEIVDYFQFFGLERKFDIDFSSLEEKYKDWINRLHTVQGQTKSEKECNYAARLLGKAYMAYRFLKRPWRRAEHIMKLNGIDVEVMDYRYCLTFTKEIREIREALKEANDSQALDQIQHQVEEKWKLWSEMFDKAIKSRKFNEAETCIQSLIVYERVDEEIECIKHKLCPSS